MDALSYSITAKVIYNLIVKSFDSGFLRFRQTKGPTFCAAHPARAMDLGLRQPAILVVLYTPLKVFDQFSLTINNSVSVVAIIIASTISFCWFHAPSRSLGLGLSLQQPPERYFVVTG